MFVLFFILSCVNWLYILEINPLSAASFANIFSHSEGCHFILFVFSFPVQKLLSLIRSHLFIFSYFNYPRRWVEKDLVVVYDKEYFSYVYL